MRGKACLATSSLGLAVDEHRLGRMQGVRPMRPSLFLRRELGRGAGPLDLIAACGAGLSGGGVRGAACGGAARQRHGAARGGTTRRSGRRKKGRLGCSPWNEVGVERVRLVIAARAEDDDGGVRCARCGAATFGARGVAR